MEQEEEIIFTPLIHFLPQKRPYTATLKKYFENKLYLTQKKIENSASKSPAHSLNMRTTSRFAKFTASTRLERN